MNSCHQRYAGAGGGGEGAGAVPGRADHDADRGQFVLALHDRVFGLAGFRVVPQFPAMAGEGVGNRRRWRDRIPGAHRGAAIDRAEGCCAVALDEDAVADLVGLLDAQPDRAFQVLQRPVAAEMQRMDVRGQELFLALVLLADQLLDDLRIHLEQGAHRAEIDDVLEQLALARIGIGRVGDRGQRHADHGDIGAEFRRRHRLGRIVEQIAAGLDRGDVLVPGLRVHRHHHVDAAAGAEMTVLGHPHLVPGRQALDVGREHVARRHRHAVAQDRAREHLVGAGRTRAVDVGEADDEVVYAADRALDGHDVPAWVISMRYFCMSQAPVGQRSAHSPQCRQTSSSLTMTRPVLRPSAT